MRLVQRCAKVIVALLGPAYRNHHANPESDERVPAGSAESALALEVEHACW